MLCLYMYLKTIYSEESQEFFMTLMAVFAPSAHKIIGGGDFKKKIHHFLYLNFFWSTQNEDRSKNKDKSRI